MSTLAHDAWGLDAQHLKWFWYDDFFGASIKDEWAVTTTGTGSAAVEDQQTGGIVRLNAPADNDSIQLDWDDYRSLLVTKEVCFEARAKLSGVGAIWFNLGMTFDNTNRIVFNEATGANFRFMCISGPSTIVDTGVAFDTAYHIFRIECHVHGGNHVHYFIDDLENEGPNSPISTNVTTNYMQAVAFINARAVAPRQLDIDYMGVEQLI